MKPSHDDLLVYLDLIARDVDLVAAPPFEPPSAEDPPWTWADVAVDRVDRGLERWAFGLTAWGREIAVTAALGALEDLMPLWERAAAARAPGADAVIENVERGFNPSPTVLHERLVAWERTPTPEAAEELLELDQGDHLDVFDVLGNEEFKACWSDTWMFALTGVYAAALLPGEDEERLPRLLAQVAISCRRALGPTPQAASLAFQRLASRLRTRRA
jgi:hypothetical protein